MPTLADLLDPIDPSIPPDFTRKEFFRDSAKMLYALTQVPESNVLAHAIAANCGPLLIMALEAFQPTTEEHQIFNEALAKFQAVGAMLEVMANAGVDISNLPKSDPSSPSTH